MVADLLKNERLKEKGILLFHRLVETNLKFNRRLEKNQDLVNKCSLERGISNVMEGFTSRTPWTKTRDRLNTEWAPGIIISSGLTRFLPAELCFRSGIYPCTVRARWLIIELESHACTFRLFLVARRHLVPVFPMELHAHQWRLFVARKFYFSPFLSLIFPRLVVFLCLENSSTTRRVYNFKLQSCLVFVSNNLNILSREIYI